MCIPPTAARGLQTGVQDAVNLGWKLAQVVRRISPERLLDTYHAERHPIGARVLRNTMAVRSFFAAKTNGRKALRDYDCRAPRYGRAARRSPR